MPRLMPHFAWYAPVSTNWYFGSTMKMLLLPLPEVCVTTTPPFTFGEPVVHSALPGRMEVGSALASALSKYSRFAPPENDARIIQLLDMRFVATISIPL